MQSSRTEKFTIQFSETVEVRMNMKWAGSYRNRRIGYEDIVSKFVNRGFWHRLRPVDWNPSYDTS